MTPRAAPILIEPAYGYATSDGQPTRPRARQAIAEWVDAVNPFKGITRLVPFLTAVAHITAGVGAIVYSTYYLTWASVPSRVIGTIVGLGVGVVYHSVWWHRYCTHRAFTFSSLAWTHLFTWTNPLFYRDETFVIPHRVHHQKADLPGDPYTPRSGWLVCYLSAETQQRLNTSISPEQYRALVRGLRHTGVRLNSYEAFKRTGSVEHVGWFLLRGTFAQVLWLGPVVVFGGPMWIAAYCSLVFWSMFLLRDFNFRGHTDEPDHHPTPGWEFGTGQALNHRLYGYMSGEWHNNHHACPRSARMGFVRGQLDLGFLFIRGLKRLGIVSSFEDQRDWYLSTRGKSRVTVSVLPASPCTEQPEIRSGGFSREGDAASLRASRM